MEINIPQLSETPMFSFSHSMAEGGENAGANTWQAALNGPRPLLNTEEEYQAFRDFVKSSGGWSEEEIAAWDINELQALFLQWIAGDVREAGADCLADIDWLEYEQQSREGQVSGNLFRTDEGHIFFSLYH